MAEGKVAFVTCVHPYYELPAVIAHRDQAIDQLAAKGFELITPPVPRSVSEVESLARELCSRQLDALILFFCTWVAEPITLSLAELTREVPLVLWSLPFLDLDIPMPSPMSGLTSSASNFRRAGRPFAAIIGHVTPETVDEVHTALRAARVVRRLRRARCGIVGDPCPGMLDVEADEQALRRTLGTEIVRVPFEELLAEARTVTPEEAHQAAQRLVDRSAGLEGLSEERLADNMRLYVAMRRLVQRYRLDAYCVRCWPELRDELKLTMCAPHALLATDGIASTCEVDLPALLSVCLLSWLTEQPAFSFDLTGWMQERDAVQLAHCGAAHPALAAGPSDVKIRAHMRTGTGATVEFPFRPGQATLAKLLRPQNGSLSLFVAAGEVLPATSPVRGNVACFKPDVGSRSFLSSMIDHGVEHHLALCYGDQYHLLETFCRLSGMRLIQP